MLDLHVTAASVGKATIREDDIKSSRCIGLHGLAFMLISAGIDSSVHQMNVLLEKEMGVSTNFQ